MEALTIEQIMSEQKAYGIDKLQNLITSGQAWHFEGSVGRSAMSALESGACFLPDIQRQDAYGNRVPARSFLKAGSKGTLENSQTFWQGVNDGSIELVNCVDECEE